MAAVSQISATIRREIRIMVPPWYRDHCFAGKIILPGVETLLLLSTEVKKTRPGFNVGKMLNARFDKVLELDADEPEVTAIIEIKPHGDNSLTATLLTRSRNKTISRLKEHGRVTFTTDHTNSHSLEAPALTLQEPLLTIHALRLYQELVPFGPAYQNICAEIQLSRQGAVTRVKSPDLPASKGTELTGSPFPLDAAFHAACVWGQRFASFIPFPVSFASRTIINRTEPGNIYEVRVIPLAGKPDEVVFDLWISTLQGELFETISTLRMRDISGGRMKPPNWIVTE